MSLNNIRALILDMDGVIWQAYEPLGDLAAIWAKFEQKQLEVVFATNNATKTGESYLDRLGSFGLRVRPEQIITSAIATGEWLAGRYPEGGKVYIIGEDGLQQNLAAKGFSHGIEGALAVVVGLDKGINYEKLRQATLLIRSGVPLIGTNPDRTYPTPEGLVPGAGAILASLEAAGDVEAQIIGKPQATMFLQALKRLGTKPEETLVVGDRLETDIAGGQAAGCRTALVLSGVTNEEQAAAWSPQPDIIAADLSSLAAQF